MKKAIISAVTAVLAVCATDAAGQPGLLMTHDVAACRSHADLAICLLGVTTSPFSVGPHPDLEHATDILALLEEWAPQAHEGWNDRDQAFVATDMDPAQRLKAAVDAALAADRRGVEPTMALKPVTSFGQELRSQSFVLGEITTPNGAQLRVFGFIQIFQAYAESIGSTGPDGRAGPPPPSRGLALAALAAWEQEIRAAAARAPAEDGSLVQAVLPELAIAYGLVGDLAALDRLDAITPGISNFVRLDVLTTAGRLDEAVDLATAAVTIPPHVASRFQKERWQLVEACLTASRRELAARVARRILDTTGNPESDIPRAARVLASAAPEPEAMALAEDLDRRARGAPSENAAVSAVAAVVMWSSMGLPDRADALIQLWLPRGRAWPENFICVDSWSTCHDATVVQMLRRADRLMEGFDGLHLTPGTAIAADLDDGRGLERLDVFLAREETAEARERALSACVEWAVANTSLEVGTTCARRLQESTASRGLNAEEMEEVRRSGDLMQPASGAYLAAKRCLQVATVAARSNDAERARALVGCSLDIWAANPSVSWDFVDSELIQEVGIALLRAEGRL